MNTGSLLSIRGLEVEYLGPRGALRAVRGADLELAAGEILALVGESGSGKTSVAQAVLGLYPASKGHVCLRGEDLGAMKSARRRQAKREIQAIFQDPLASLSPRRTILQALIEPIKHYRLGKSRDFEQMASQALRSVELDDSLLSRYPHELSGGQRQRVALARALAPRPSLIIADEPLSSLDLPAQVRMLNLFRRLRDEQGLAFMIISHDLSVMRRFADNVAVMYLGSVVESGPARRILVEPAHPYTRALLAAVPVADPAHPAPIVLPGEATSPLTPQGGCVFHKRCREALARCAREAPAETILRDGQAAQSTHKVRCHLWNS